MSNQVIIPGDGDSNQLITLNPGRLSEYGRWLANSQVPLGLINASFSDYLELKVLDHIFNDGTFTVPSTVALGLWTSALTDASTGATSGEAAYTTYARVTTGAADFSAAAAGSKTNTNAFTFPACTASSSTITFWGTFDSATIGAGNMLVWGTATSTVISTTQTPPTVAIGGLVVTLD